ncbi:MAG: cob(I)yrinic acid a,c-diamide adenosyltransferase [Candidatus Aminicenantales bacterium]
MAEERKAAPKQEETKVKHKGYIHVYTGNGKGKTTAALGLALRAAGHNMYTYVGQFLKGQTYGELIAVKKLAPYITIEQFGRKGFIHVTRDPDQEDIKRAKHGLEKCLKAMLSMKYRIVILDEINVAVYFNLITKEEVLEFLEQKPEEVEVVLTGRYAPPAFIKKADLVTEMKEKKHYYRKGVKSRPGIEK